VSFELSDNELRVLGALLEKQVTTPDQYPLTLKALVSACNQKSNREPVMALSESEVRATVALLEQRYLISKRTEYGSRVTKHRQRMCNTEFGTLKFEPGEFAIMCLLMLRGPQTPGELRSRSGRLHAFDSVDEVNETLTTLATRDDGPFVVRLQREPGRRESRYAHLLGAEAPQSVDSEPQQERTSAPPRAAPKSGDDRVGLLEKRVEALEQELAQLKDSLGVNDDP